MNRDYIDEQITTIVDKLDDLWAQVHDLSVELEVHGHNDACTDLDLYKIKRELNRMYSKLWNTDRLNVLYRHFPDGRDPDRLREDAEDCARP